MPQTIETPRKKGNKKRVKRSFKDYIDELNLLQTT